ncbi:hypothetical protein O0555_02155 [Brevibacillus laterosporus]|uniref:hypothetical protein n=1 Tax=Brevibacillus laterosporus TaxID=1465 RepID=UPI0018CD4582|nr:hypothetical protein [Brevibacillus laterosporus]MBG9797493.1 hypothetical protein [Brevibacillus laterosporus]MCR8936157.1 hypothetical protein [Brevibacillus laterosporus]MCZ0838796.1 hypothetical protein [Brevibacillus laterosporus]MCZ0844826.1 hypothetical protein [Brevibacillus laterosporus]MED1913064.1 hypothetical protein [Brevibacillus laterosporus]
MKRYPWLNASVFFFILGVVVAGVAVGTLIHTLFFYLMSLIFDIRIESIFSVIAFSVSVYLLIIPAVLSSFISSVINTKLAVRGIKLRFFETVVTFVLYYFSVFFLETMYSGISISSMGIVTFALIYTLLIRYDELYNYLKSKIIS